MCYSLWYNATTVLPAGSLDAVEPHPGYRSATLWMPYTTNFKYSLVLVKMGEIVARNILSCLELLINRYCFIHLVVYNIVSVMHVHTNIKPAIYIAGNSV